MLIPNANGIEYFSSKTDFPHIMKQVQGERYCFVHCFAAV